MKTKVVILVLLSILFSSCVQELPTQEDEVVDVATEEISTEEPVSQTIATEEPIVTEEPTEAPTETPIACVTLLSPVNGVEIPPVGKVTFSWTALNEAGKYVLNIILPTGDIVPFETDQTIYDRYMEAFTFGGEYQWQVIAQDENGSEICVSEVAKFNKPAYNPPKGNNNSSNSGEETGEESKSGSCTVDCGPPPPPPGGGQD